MKKFSTVLLVLLIASATLFAGVNFSGGMKAGYKFTIKDGVTTAPITAGGVANKDGYLYLNVTDDAKIFKITFKGTPDLNESNYMKANLSVSLTNSLKAAGLDTGDFGASFSIGANSNMSGLNVYSDPLSTLGDNSYKLRTSGGYSTGLTLSYSTIVTANVASNFKEGGEANVVVSASTTPVAGVSASFGYANLYQNKHTGLTGKNAIDGAVAVDVAKLASLEDLALVVSAHDAYYLDTKLNYLTASAKVAYAKITGIVEYSMYNKVNGLTVKGIYDGIENLSVYAKYALADFSQAKDTSSIGAGASYKLAGVTYGLDLGFALSNNAFTVGPYVKVTF